MIITCHYSPKMPEPFYKGIAHHAGRRLVFFGWTKGHVMAKEAKWLNDHADLLNDLAQARSGERPVLRVIQGGVA